MILSPDLSQFRAYFPKDWFFPEVISAFDWVDKHPSMHYDDIVELINTTVKNAVLPGVTDPGTSPQAKGKAGDNSRSEVTFTTGRQIIDYMNREFTMTLAIDNFFINWFMFLFQMDLHIQKKAKDSGGSEFLKPIYAELLDYEQRVVVSMRFYNIRIARLSQIAFNVGDSGVGNVKTFDIDFRYEGLEIDYELGSRYNDNDSRK